MMLSSLLPLTALLAPALAIVEPLNTTILGPYGFVPPVYPSRKFYDEEVPRTLLTVLQQILLALVGKRL